MGILDRLDLEITSEALSKMGFYQRLYSKDLDMRYHLEDMSNIEKADMINENIYYEYRICNYYNIVVRYYPDSFSLKFYDCALGKYSRMEDLHWNNTCVVNHDYSGNEDRVGDRQYNLSITCEGKPYTPTAGQKVMCDTLRELECWSTLQNYYLKKKLQMSMSVLSLDRSINKDSLKSIGFDISKECRCYTKFDEYSNSIYYEFEHDLEWVGPFGKSTVHFSFLYYPKNYDGPVIMYARHNNIAAQNVVFAFTGFGYLNVGVYNPKDIDDLAVWIQSRYDAYRKIEFKID